MRFKWASRKKYLSTWNDKILTPLQNLVFGQLNFNNNKIDLLGFTELKVMEESEVAYSTGSKTVEHKYRAHPSYCSGPSWHSWANVKWELTETNIQMFPARMIMFLKTGKDVPTSVRERLPAIISNNFALIQSIDYSVGGNRTRQDWPLLNGPLNKSYTMENQFRIVDVAAITGHMTIIKDKLFVDSTKIKSCSVISDISTWTS